MRVIGTVGLPGSGKGEAAAVANEEAIPVVVMGDVIREACRERGLDPAEHHGKMASTLREEEGEAVIAERTLPRIHDALSEQATDDDDEPQPADDPDSDHDRIVLVDGIRSMVEVDRFREAFGDDFILVSIEAPFDLRADRLQERARDRSDATLESLRERDTRELDLGMGEVMAAADATIENTDTLAVFRATVRTLLREGTDAIDDGTITADPDR